MKYFDLTDRVALVTGGNRGIGRAIALAFSNAGAKVVIAARNKDLLDKVVKEIEAQNGNALGVYCDLSSDSDIYSLVKKTTEAYGKLDILVNNAAISPFVKKSEKVSKEEWEEVIRVNLTAPFLLCREAGKIMIQNNWGRIINVASVGGMSALPRQIAYCAAKAGMIQMTRSLAIEWSQKYNITVNAIAPGWVATDLTAGIQDSETLSRSLLQRIPQRRFGEPDEIVGAALYLASEYSGYSSGSVVVVDGGWMAA